MTRADPTPVPVLSLVSKGDERPDLAELKRLYESTKTPVFELVRLSGLGYPQFYALIRQENWALRRPRREIAPAYTTTQPPIDRAIVVRRAWAAADAQMREIEGRLARLGQPKAADSEREARLMATLVKTLRDLVALEGEIGPLDRKDADANATDTAANDGGSDLRDELARRLARLRAERGRAPSAGEPR